jgi:hypothetical protein
VDDESIRRFKMTYICTGSARKKNMLAQHVHTGLRNVIQRISRNVLVASFRCCRRSVAVFEAEEAMTICCGASLSTGWTELGVP